MDSYTPVVESRARQGGMNEDIVGRTLQDGKVLQLRQDHIVRA
jgi:hypothetical protein